MGHLHALGRKLARFTQDNAAKIQAADPEPPAARHDRAADNWRPLLAIAEVAGCDWLARGRKAALEIHGASDDADERGVQLLGDIRLVFDASDGDALWTEELLDRLVAMKERPWCEDNRGKPLTARGLAAMLKPFGIAADQVWRKGSNKRGYALSQFKEAPAIYLLDR